MPTDGWSSDGDTVAVGQSTLRVIHWSATPRARSPCCTTTRHGAPHLFTGDSLFPGGVGNTQGDPERFS